MPLRARARCAGKGVCVDSPPNWVNGLGADCAMYERNNWCYTGDYTDKQHIHAATSKTANQGCCTCGGGAYVSAGESAVYIGRFVRTVLHQCRC